METRRRISFILAAVMLLTLATSVSIGAEDTPSLSDGETKEIHYTDPDNGDMSVDVTWTFTGVTITVRPKMRWNPTLLCYEITDISDEDMDINGKGELVINVSNASQQSKINATATISPIGSFSLECSGALSYDSWKEDVSQPGEQCIKTELETIPSSTDFSAEWQTIGLYEHEWLGATDWQPGCSTLAVAMWVTFPEELLNDLKNTEKYQNGTYSGPSSIPFATVTLTLEAVPVDDN